MFNLLKWFFTIFGILSFIFCLGLGYGWMTDAYGVRTATTAVVKMFRAETSMSETTGTESETATYLTSEQKTSLEDVGINTTSLPTSLTQEQKQCMIEKVGQARADAIMAGASPTPIEILAGASCL